MVCKVLYLLINFILLTVAQPYQISIDKVNLYSALVAVQACDIHSFGVYSSLNHRIGLIVLYS